MLRSGVAGAGERVARPLRCAALILLFAGCAAPSPVQPEGVADGAGAPDAAVVDPRGAELEAEAVVERAFAAHVAAWPRPEPQQPDTRTHWYVDSVGGNDVNAGTTAASPLRSLGALLGKPLQPEAVIHLARGSHFREQLSGLPAGATVEAYGQGARPLLDASDVAANADFSKVAGMTGVYELQWSHALRAGGKTLHSVWEDGARLKRVSDAATCAATPGSFFAPTPSVSGVDTILVHASDGSAIPRNGKRYELARREYGVVGPVGGRLFSLHARRNGHNDGSIISIGYAKDCVAEDGTIHNFWNTGVAEDCLAIGNEGYGQAGASSMFVTYTDLPGLEVWYRNCRAQASSSAGTIGFYVHTGKAGVKYARVVYDRCSATNVELGFGGADVERLVYRRCEVDRSYRAIGGAGEHTYVLGGRFNGWSEAAPFMDRIFAPPRATPRLVVHGVRAVTRISSGALVWASGEVELSQSTFVFADPGGTNLTHARVDSGSLRLRRNVFVGARKIPIVEVGVGVPLDSDQNLFWTPLLVMRLGGVSYLSLEEYQSATRQDEHSLLDDPRFAGDLRLGDTRLSRTSPAEQLGAGADFWHEPSDPALHEAFAP